MPEVAVAVAVDGVVVVAEPTSDPPIADALVTTRPGLGLVVLVADCIPVLLSDRRAGVVAAVHVGRRGLAPDALAAALAGRVPVDPIGDARAALRAALSRAGADDAVLVTGSLFLVGEAYAELGGGSLFEPWHGPKSDGTEARV